MNRLSIRARLVLTFAVPLAALIVIEIIGLYFTNNLQQDYDDLSDRQIPLIIAIEDVQLAGSRLVSSANEYVLDETLSIAGEEDDEDELDEILESIEDLEAELATYGRLRSNEDAQDGPLYEAVAASSQLLIDDALLITELVEQDAAPEAFIQARTAFETREENFLEALDAAEDEEKDHLEAAQATVAELVQLKTYLGIVLGISAALFLTVFGWFTYRSVINPIRSLEATTQAIADGNLSLRADVSSKDEIGRLAESFNFMTEVISIREMELRDYTAELDKRVKERTVELKDARDKALAAQRLAMENSRLKSEFLSTMSHELRTPLNAIEGFTSIMLSGMGVELSPRAEDMTKRIASNSKRLLQLINDFLDLSRIEAGRLELVDAPIQPARLAVRWMSELSILADKKGITFKANIDPDLPPTILADEDAVSKIAVNLLSNALKFTKEGGVTLSLQRFADGWAIVVADTGIGIPSHAREYIFEEFRQVDGSSKREFGGTGLGLALVQKLARAMNGRVMLDSEVGKGSTFTVVLPLHVPETSLEGVNHEQ